MRLYSFVSLKTKLPGFLDSIDVSIIRKFKRKYRRYIDAYSKKIYSFGGRKSSKAISLIFGRIFLNE